ncbi:MAG: hypothetical protein Q9164_002684 [Protoblastenia rupestris]
MDEATLISVLSSVSPDPKAGSRLMSSLKYISVDMTYSDVSNEGIDDTLKVQGDDASSGSESVFDYEQSEPLEPYQIKEKHQEIIQEALVADLLRDAGKEDFRGKWESFFDLKGEQQESILHLLVNEMNDRTYDRYTPFLTLLLDHSPQLPTEVNGENKTALHFALLHHKSKVAMHLCENVTLGVDWIGISKDKHDTCLHIALKRNLDCAVHLIRKIRAAGPAAAKILRKKGEDGHTALHIASEYERCNPSQVEIVRLLLEGPDAQDIENDVRAADKSEKGGLSPLRYHEHTKIKYDEKIKRQQETLTPSEPCKTLRSRPQGQSGRKSPSNSKMNLKPTQRASPGPARAIVSKQQPPDAEAATQIKSLLLRNCMEKRSREEAARIIYGPNNHKHINFDLFSRQEISLKALEAMWQTHVQFEEVLQYVAIPNLKVNGFESEEWTQKPYWQSEGRKDYLFIFDWLQKKGVKQILRIVVEDDEDCPHSDEVIVEALKTFDIRIWDWRKYDICVDTMLLAAKNAHNVKIYCKGNNGILQSWSYDGGLTRLEKGWETYQKAQINVAAFKERLTNASKDLKIKCTIPRRKKVPEHNNTSKIRQGLPEHREHWISCMAKFAEFIRGYPIKPNIPLEEVKVALLDDGVDTTIDGLNEIIPYGETFSKRPKDLWNPYHFSTNGHGTTMAVLIRRICPNIKLYVAKLEEESGYVESISDYDSRITVSSASKAIEWARRMGVHIISMSWSIVKENERGFDDFKKATNNAINDGILMFAASDDQGNTKAQETYPTNFNNNIFRIGAATVYGHKGENVQNSVDYILPGDMQLVQSLDKNIQLNQPRTASSLSTALASGLAALVLRCAALKSASDFHKAWSRETMVKAFDAICGKNQYLHVQKVFGESLAKYDPVDGHEHDILNDVVHQLLGT